MEQAAAFLESVPQLAVERAVPREHYPIQMVVHPAAQAQQQQPPAQDSLLTAQGGLEQRGKTDADAPAEAASGDRCHLNPEVDPSTPAASTPGEHKEDDKMGDKGGKRSAEEADCFPENGEGEEEAGQPSAKKPAATRRTVRISDTPEDDSLLKA